MPKNPVAGYYSTEALEASKPKSRLKNREQTLHQKKTAYVWLPMYVTGRRCAKKKTAYVWLRCGQTGRTLHQKKTAYVWLPMYAMAWLITVATLPDFSCEALTFFSVSSSFLVRTPTRSPTTFVLPATL